MKITLEKRIDKFKIKILLLCLKKNKFYYLIVFFALLFSFASVSYAGTAKKQNYLEETATLIKTNIEKQTFPYQNLEIKFSEEKVKEINFYTPLPKDFAGEDFYKSKYKYGMDYGLTVSSLNVEKNISLLIPRTITILNKNDRYYMESLGLETMFKYSRKSNLSCYISDKFADELMKKLNLTDYEQLLDKSINLNNKNKGKSYVCKIANIYYTNDKYGDYYYKTSGEFIILNYLPFAKDEGLSLSIDLNKAIYRNMGALKVLLDKYPIDQYEWNFIDGYDDNYNVNLNNKIQYLFNYNESTNSSFILTLYVLAILMYIFTIFVIVKCGNRSKKLFLDSKIVFYEVSMLIFFAFTFAFYLFKFLKMSKFLCSNSVLIWLLMSVLALGYVKVSLMNGRKDENVKATNNQ